MKKFLYLGVYILPVLTLLSVSSYGWLCWSPVLFIFVLVPIVELMLQADDSNLSAAEKEVAESSHFYEFLLLSFLVLHPLVLVLFLLNITDPNLATYEILGRILSVGIVNGACAINVAHELGHRKSKWKLLAADFLLLTSLENHFRPYHTYCHHKNVATSTDPATAKKGEWAYVFWIKEQVGTYFQAWEAEKQKAISLGKAPYSFHNVMLNATIAQFLVIALIYLTLGLATTLAFIAAAIIGMIILAETSYIEHYGLMRKKDKNGRYEKVNQKHSWNSDHPLGRLLLFELSRHSDHHYKAYKPFQTLDHIPNSPQMPTGYPGMMILSLIPPLFFKVVDPEIERIG